MVEWVVSTVKKSNHSSWQNAEVCQSHCWHDIQWLLLSLWQFFCRRIVKENWKILTFPQHFIANVLSIWILKTVAVPKQGESPYYRLQITYSDWDFSLRISSIWWFKHFISSRWNCLIIMNITVLSLKISSIWWFKHFISSR